MNPDQTDGCSVRSQLKPKNPVNHFAGGMVIVSNCKLDAVSANNHNMDRGVEIPEQLAALTSVDFWYGHRVGQACGDTFATARA
jgi:hypothetical protein